MEISELQNLKKADLLTVSFGSRGTQVAKFCRWGECQGHKSLVVVKWRKNSQRWTGQVHILPGDVKTIVSKRL